MLVLVIILIRFLRCWGRLMLVILVELVSMEVKFWEVLVLMVVVVFMVGDGR